MADRLAWVKAVKVGETLTDVKVAAPEVKAITVNDKDGIVQANYCSILAKRQAQVQP